MDGTADEAELETLKENFETNVLPDLRSLTTPRKDITFKDGTSTSSGYKKKHLIVAPIYLSLKDEVIDSEGEQIEESRTYSFYMGVVPKETTIEVKSFEWSDLKYYAAILVTLVLSLMLSTYCVF